MAYVFSLLFLKIGGPGLTVSLLLVVVVVMNLDRKGMVLAGINPRTSICCYFSVAAAAALVVGGCGSGGGESNGGEENY